MATIIQGQLVFHHVGYTVIDLPPVPQPDGLPPMRMKSIIFQIAKLDDNVDAQLHFPMTAGEASQLAAALEGRNLIVPPGAGTVIRL